MSVQLHRGQGTVSLYIAMFNQWLKNRSFNFTNYCVKLPYSNTDRPLLILYPEIAEWWSVRIVSTNWRNSQCISYLCSLYFRWSIDRFKWHWCLFDTHQSCHEFSSNIWVRSYRKGTIFSLLNAIDIFVLLPVSDKTALHEMYYPMHECTWTHRWLSGDAGMQWGYHQIAQWSTSCNKQDKNYIIRGKV